MAWGSAGKALAGGYAAGRIADRGLNLSTTIADKAYKRYGPAPNSWRKIDDFIVRSGLGKMLMK